MKKYLVFALLLPALASCGGSSGGGNSTTPGPGITAVANTTAQSLTVGTAMTNFTPLSASGGATPYTFSYTGTLPSGLSFGASTGVVSGTPNATYATANIVFSVKDAKNTVASTNSTVSFTVVATTPPPPTPPIAIANTTAQVLTVGTPMTSFSPLSVSGGTPPYTFSFTGTLPAGLSFDTGTGTVTGTPTAVYASADLIFSVKDSNNALASTTSTVNFSVAAAPPPSDRLDLTFNATGKVLTDFNSGGDGAVAVAIQSDGKIVVAGTSYGTTTTGYDFALARYNKDGSLDTNFGTGGILTTDFGNGTDTASSLAIQSDGKIIVAGNTNQVSSGGPWGLAMARYNTDGSLDSSFGTLGIVTTNNTADNAKSIALQSDGMIIVGSTAATGFQLARYKTDGSLDTTYGTAGKVITPIYSIPGSDLLNAITLQSDGKVIAVGQANPTWEFAVVRYNSDGSLDANFGTAGIVTTDLGGVDNAKTVAIQTDGKIVVGGDPGVSLVRYNSDGSLDNTFGSLGKVTTTTPAYIDYVSAVLVQGDKKIVTVGTQLFGGATGTFLLERYNADGSLDTTFGTGGKLATNFAPFSNPNTLAYAGAIQIDGIIGKIVAVGTANYDFAVVRYLQ